ncbi:hypothetical protein [Nocardia cyriacigeorgica]|uniref:hypothetical protein n=1 Tax=Nocardia cyriacigeorgica TaxID=135487 RepID=UPI002491CC56|nr:hypothetical protein [Nocardia cyriacigeorgica]BDT85956.1 hypothetical protein FMUAM8_17200 [Nocardia cyriacigeorgica]
MSERIECLAYRRGREWVAHVPEHGVYGHGPTLKAVRRSTAEGLAYIGITANVTAVAASPELENLRTIADTYSTALREAVHALARCSATVGDIASATNVPTQRIRALLAEIEEQDFADKATTSH